MVSSFCFSSFFTIICHLLQPIALARSFPTATHVPNTPYPTSFHTADHELDFRGCKDGVPTPDTYSILVSATAMNGATCTINGIVFDVSGRRSLHFKS